jgi:hypothetical protein
MSSDKTGVEMKKGEAKFKFDLVIPTHKGVIFAVYIKPTQQEGKSLE